MIWIVIMLGMIGQALNMTASYWIILGMWIFCFVLINSIKLAIKITQETEKQKEEDTVQKLINHINSKGRK